MEYQKTIASEVSHTGIGLHTGCKTTVTFKPALPDTGIRFIRKVDGKDFLIKVDVSSVLEAPRRTTLGAYDVKIHTVEHILAAATGLGIDNLEIEVDESEVPEIDGSSLPFAEILDRAGILEQKAQKKYLKVRRAVSVSDGDAELTAVPSDVFKISFTIDYDKPGLEGQYASFEINRENFLKEIAPARTFCFEDEAKKLQAEGLGKGANLNNTVVISEDGIINGKTRFKNEFVRHKILDLLGDLSLVGKPILGHIIATKSGHSSNIKLVKELKKMTENSPPEQGKQTVIFDTEAIQKILPHRYPFLLVDRIIELEEDKRIVGIKNVTADEHFFVGHFPQRPIMPGVLVVEAMAQTAGVLMLNKEQNIGKLAYVMSIDNVRLRKPIVPGDQLRLEVEVCKLRKKTGKVKAKTFVEEQLVAEAEFVFSVVDV
jgi:UDP-3-O-[3-hydroxymyristoyl] N-acetylglucosamine deacetylase/3-hydroxyacyl-[acyl-carrier-protein] dehydratase